MARASLIFLNATVVLSHQVFRFNELITLGVFSFAHSRNRIVIVADGSFQWLTSLFTTISYQNWIWRVNSRELTLGRSTTSCVETQWKKNTAAQEISLITCAYFIIIIIIIITVLLLLFFSHTLLLALPSEAIKVMHSKTHYHDTWSNERVLFDGPATHWNTTLSSDYVLINSANIGTPTLEFFFVSPCLKWYVPFTTLCTA